MAQTTSEKLIDIVERTVFTAGEALLGVLLVRGTISMSAAEIAVLTAIAGGLGAVRTLVSQLIASQLGAKEWIEDMLSRAVFTFAQTLLAALITAAATNLDMSAIKAAAVAAAAAAFSALKSALANGIANSPDSPAALLPTSHTA